jgi:serine/threonine-protein kinase
VRADAIRLHITLDVLPPEPDDSVQVDRVISTDPEAGTVLQPGEKVTVVVSSGKEQVPVPNMNGQTRTEANDTLRAAGLVLGNVTNEPSDQPAGEVIRSEPGAGISVGKGSQVAIVLSRGPTPSPTPSPTPLPTPPPTPTPSPCPSTPCP